VIPQKSADNVVLKTKELTKIQKKEAARAGFGSFWGYFWH
jgi:hypothetical protein